ncbi:CotH protein [Fibrobacter sp. UWH9]|uniref:CotH kinase family protein n=1 Tax=Fibrobacter sp. UWH9 TaxID=1896213 RepID=UPI000914A691|nr:CotH kinase family protein [Fibrobacter sp. UWH9]SHH78048.1 CotH protein [Fibrobacter sp. UWH9]
MNKKIVRMSVMARYALAGSLILGTALGTTACSDDSSTGADDSTTGELINSSESSEPIYDENGNIISSASGDVSPVDPNNPAPLSSAGVVDPNNPSPNSNGSTEPTPVDPNNPVPTSSAGVITEPSSSALKEYDDNHAPKESFLPPAGFYTSLTIDPPTPQKGGQIKCTFDGSFPTQNSESITAAKPITENTVIRCSEFVNGQAADTTTQTYFINENVTMPVVALTVNHHDMFDSTDGLYATGPLTNNQGGGMWDIGGFGATDNNNPKCSEPCKQANFWKDTELPVHVEFFENGSSTKTKNWEFDAGISIIGNYSRYKPKKSVAIKMDNDNYGDKTLKYSLFKTRPEAKKFKAFNLRNNGNRFWTDYFGDPMLVSLMEGTEVDYQRSRQVVVFYNGEYFGIHDMRERLNRSFAETNYGVDSKSINVVKNCSNGDEGYQNGWCPSGTNGASANEFAQLVNTITSGNFEGENNQQYEEVKKKLNISSFAQYMIAEMYIHNGDWPNNNIRFWGSPANGQPFKAMIFDVDHGYGFSPGITGFDTESQNMFQWVLGSATMDNNNGGNQGGNQGGIGGIGGFGGGMGGWGMGSTTTLGNMLKKLLANPDFKRLFINQSCILLNSYLTYEKVQAAVQNMLATIPSSEQSRDEQRWPRNQSSFTWAPSGSDLLRFAQNRTETTRQELANYFGLSGEVSVTLSASGNGKIYVDEMALPSTTYQGKFLAGNPLKLTAVAVSGGVFTGWSDGSTENPRLVEPSAGMTLTAQFK